MRRFAAAFVDTLRAVLTVRDAFLVLLFAGVIYSFFYPESYRRNVVNDMRVAVVDQDHSSTSRALLRRIDALREVRISGQETTLENARKALEARQVEGVLLLPVNLERDILRGGAGRVVVLGDGAYLARASAVLEGASGALGDFGVDQAMHQAVFMGAPLAPPLTLVDRPLYNHVEGFGSAYVPGVAMLIIHQTLLVGIGILLGKRRRELGRRLHFDGASLLGTAAAFMLIGLRGVMYYSGFVFWFQDYPRGGNLPGLLVAAVLFVGATVSLGLLIGSFFDTGQRSLQYIIGTSIVFFFLANLSWPAVMSPPALMTLAKLLPFKPGMNALVGLNQMGVSLNEVSAHLWNLVLLIVGYGTLAAYRLGAIPGFRIPREMRESPST